MDKPIYIISHQRSGTHLTIDLIRNNFKSYNNYFISFNEIDLDYQKYLYSKSMLLKSRNRIFKSHSYFNSHQFYKSNAKVVYKRYLSNSKLIYVFRNPKDVMASLFHYYIKNSYIETLSNPNTFVNGKNTYHVHSEIENIDRIEYWTYHVNSWLNNIQNRDVFFLSFEKILQNYKKTIDKLSFFLEEESNNNLVDVRINDPNQKIEFTFSSVLFRKGSIGDGIELFNTKTLDYIDYISSSTYKNLILYEQN